MVYIVLIKSMNKETVPVFVFVKIGQSFDQELYCYVFQPLVGEEPNLMKNLQTFFELNYPKVSRFDEL